jgi:hypothetical protein
MWTSPACAGTRPRHLKTLVVRHVQGSSAAPSSTIGCEERQASSPSSIVPRRAYSRRAPTKPKDDPGRRTGVDSSPGLPGKPTTAGFARRRVVLGAHRTEARRLLADRDCWGSRRLNLVGEQVPARAACAGAAVLELSRSTGRNRPARRRRTAHLTNTARGHKVLVLSR